MHGTPHLGAARLQRGRAERRDYIEALRCIGVPTLVIVGESDAFTPVETAVQVADAIPVAEIVFIPEAGHMPNLEAPAGFNEALSNLIGGGRA